MKSRLVLAAALVLLLSACEEPLLASDAGVDVSGPVPNGSQDAGKLLDGGSDGGLSQTCEGACLETSLLAEVDGNQAPLTRAQFGYTSPSESSSGEWELYLEAHAGGDAACPTAASPTPDRTVIIGGIRLASLTAPQTSDGGVTLVLLDYEGTLTQELFVRGSDLTLSPVSASLCPGCAQDGGSSSGQHFAFDVTARLPDGGVSGHGYAEHCVSLDAL